jgi:hypothetical protein
MSTANRLQIALHCSIVINIYVIDQCLVNVIGHYFPSRHFRVCSL